MIACEIPSFTKFIWDNVWHTTSRDNIIEFVEVEYRSQGLHNYPRSKYLLGQKRDTELQNLPPRQPESAKNILSKAVGLQTIRDENIENTVKVDLVKFVYIKLFYLLNIMYRKLSPFLAYLEIP